MAKKDICPHCHAPIKIRNQSGYCDHLRYPEGCMVCSGAENKRTKEEGDSPIFDNAESAIAWLNEPMPKQQDAEWKEETTGLAIELAGMVIEGIVSNKKKQTFHVSRIAGKLQKIIDKRVAAERKRSIKLFAEHLLTLKDGTHDVRAEARRFILSIEKLTKKAGTGKQWNEIRLRRGHLDDIVLDNGDLHLEDMRGNVWWLGFYRGNKRTSFFIRSKSEITVEIQENDLEAKMVEQEK